MSRAVTFAWLAIWVLAFVAGQLLLRAALDRHTRRALVRRGALFTAAIVCMTFSFFLEIKLLETLDVSFVFPFQGLSVLIIALGAALFLKERLSIPLIVGSLLITAGVVLVGAS